MIYGLINRHVLLGKKYFFDFFLGETDKKFYVQTRKCLYIKGKGKGT